MMAKFLPGLNHVARTLFMLTCPWIKTTLAHSHAKADTLGSHFHVEGDLYLALVESVSLATMEPGLCDEHIRDLAVLQRILAFEFAIQEVNKNSSLLPGTKLGYVVIDDCLRESMAINRFSALAPRLRSCYDRRERDKFLDVVGVVGCKWSGGSVLLSLTLAPYQIPVISHSSTADSLSNREKYSNFYRLIPPDMHQVQGIVEFIKTHGWRYVSIAYSQETYGSSAYANIMRLFQTEAICVDGEIPVSRDLDGRACEAIVNELAHVHTAKIVVVFEAESSVMCFVQAIEHLGVQDELVWIGSDSWAKLFTETKSRPKFPPGLFVVTFQTADVPGFRTFLSSDSNNNRTWMREKIGGTWSCPTTPCNVADFMSRQRTSLLAATMYDIVQTYAHAMQNMLRYKCINVTRHTVYTCFCQHRKEFMDYIQRTDIFSLTGRINFDKTGSRLSTYSILHAQINPVGKITSAVAAIYDIKSRRLVLQDRHIWSGFKGNVAPESTCTRPCHPGEYKIRLGCCWICKPCKSNEIVTQMESRCTPCPKYTRPDDEHKRCVHIPHVFPLGISHIGVIFAVVLVALGVISTIVILLIFIMNRDHIVIVSAFPQLSILQTISMLMGYVAIALFLCVPSVKVCTAAFILLPFSFNTLYAAALLKAIRLFNTIQGSKVHENVPTTSTQSLCIAMLFVILLQISFQVGLSFLAPISVELHHGEDNDDFVEIHCAIPFLRITLFLIVNIFLLLLCSYFSYQTKVLPNSFTESRYVAWCVITTVMTWLAFMPALSILDHTATQTLLLCYIVILNLLTASLFLFCMRLYELFRRPQIVLLHKFRHVDIAGRVSISKLPSPLTTTVSNDNTNSTFGVARSSSV